MDSLELNETMMTAMIKPSDSNPDSDNSATPPHTKSNTNHPLKLSNKIKYKPTLKSKILGLKSKDIMQKSLLLVIFLHLTFLLPLQS